MASAQVQNAADVHSGAYSTAFAPGSRALIPNLRVTTATVSLLPVNSTTPIPADVVKLDNSGIAFVIPADMPEGPAQLIYKPGNQATQWTSVTIVPSNLSLYRTGPGGPLIAQNVQPSGAYPNGLSTPAQPGQGVQIWASGLGATPPPDVRITLGGVPQQILYIGSPPGEPGLHQINFLVAPGTPDGCYVPLILTYGTHTAAGFISKTSDGNPCHHPWGLSKAAMQQLDLGNTIQVGEFTLSTGIEAASANLASRTESGQFELTLMNASQIATYFTASAPAQTCSRLSATSGIIGGFGIGNGGAPTATIAKGTSSLQLPWTNPTPSDSPLNALPPAALSAGNWTASTAANFALPATSFAFVLPPPIQLTGSALIQVNRSQNQTITWNGSGYDSTATLNLSLTAPGSLPISCTAPAQAGSLTIPSSLLSLFSAASTGSLSVSVAETGSGIPAAGFASGNNPFLMLVLWNSTDARPVDFQ